MLTNYFIIALRNLLRNKLFSFINISGFTAGLSIIILCTINIRNEISFDAFHKDSGKIYRVLMSDRKGDRVYGSIPEVFSNLLKQSCPEIVNQAKYLSKKAEVKSSAIINKEQVQFVDDGFFNLFSFPLKTGSINLFGPDKPSVLLSQSVSQKMFGVKDPIGSSLKIKWNNEFREFIVCGILNDNPSNSSIELNIVLPFSYIQNDGMLQVLKADWAPGDHFPSLFVKLNNAGDKSFIESKISTITKMNSRFDELLKYSLIPVSDIHFTPNIGFSTITGGSKTPLYVFICIALIITLIISVNYINLSIVRASYRYKEIGIRRVAGAETKNIIAQFIGETFIVSGLSFILSIALSAFLLPFINELLHKKLVFSFDPELMTFLVVILTLITLLSGGYPAYVFSKFPAADILKGEYRLNKIRKTSSVYMAFQFSLVVILITLSVIISHQYYFLMNKDAGFNNENIVMIKTNEFFGRHINSTDVNTYKTVISSIPGVKLASLSDMVLGGDDRPLGNSRYVFESNSIFPKGFNVDENTIPLFGFKLIEGRNFSADRAADSISSIIVNEKFVKELGIKNPKTASVSMALAKPRFYNIIGVVKDFNYGSMKDKIEPVVFFKGRENFSSDYLYLKINNFDKKKLVTELEAKWKELIPAHAFIFSFLDDRIENFYKSEKKWRDLILYSSAIAVFFACLGLFAMLMYSLQKRRKEIGVRKVLGASTSSIMLILLKEYSLVLCFSLLAGFSIAFFIAENWLRNFEFRIELGVIHFFITALFLTVVSVITIFFIIFKAANTDPVISLKYE